MNFRSEGDLSGHFSHLGSEKGGITYVSFNPLPFSVVSLYHSEAKQLPCYSHVQCVGRALPESIQCRCGQTRHHSGGVGLKLQRSKLQRSSCSAAAAAPPTATTATS